MLGRALGILLLTSWPAVAAAQSNRLSLNWDHCVGAGVLSDQTFDCGNPEAFQRLVLELRPPSFANFFAADIAIDLIETGQSDALRPFWHYEVDGCNANGLAYSADRSVLGAGTVGCASTITGSAGTLTSALITAYGAGYGGANRARLLLTLARSAASPIQLVDGTDYYVGHLTFNTANSCSGNEQTCYGCRDQVSVGWRCATLYSTTSSTFTIVGPACVTVNGGPVECEPSTDPYFPCSARPNARDDSSPAAPSSTENDCSKEVTSLKSHTWGWIKSHYR